MSTPSLSAPEDQAYLATLRHLWPLVQQRDGRDSQLWQYVRTLRRIARQTVQRHYFGQDGTTPSEEHALLLILEDLQENLTHNDGVRHPLIPGQWTRVVAQLTRVLPLVEHLLAR